MAVTALRIRMTRLLLYLFASHDELGVSEADHSLPVRMAQNALITRLIAGIEVDEEQYDNELSYDDRHAHFTSKKFPQSADCHDVHRLPQEYDQNN